VRSGIALSLDAGMGGTIASDGLLNGIENFSR
jgi:hypothetical protein